MTALAGAVGGRGVDRERFCRASLQAQRAYGCSDVRFNSLERASFGCHLARFVVEDLADNQPLICRGGKTLFIADVRLDNRSELIDRFRLPRHASDSAILLGAWLRLGAEALNLICGPFALAAWDEAEGELVLARDPFGERPLFVWSTDQRTYFATTPIGLLEPAVLPLRWNYSRLARAMVSEEADDEQTSFVGMRKVRPGHVVRIRQGRWASLAYREHVPATLHLRNHEYVECYREQLERSVAAQMRRRSGQVAAHLSSGYDSTAVAVTAARLQAPTPLLALTCAPSHQDTGFIPDQRIADESPLASLTAQRHGMTHLIVRTSGRALQLLRSHSLLYQEPARNVANMDWYSSAADAARDHEATVLLGAQMGNLTIHATGLWILNAWIERGDWKGWFKQARAAKTSLGARWRGVLFNSAQPNLRPSMMRRLYNMSGVLPSSAAERFLQPEWHRALQHVLARPTAAGYVPGPYASRRAALTGWDLGLFRKGTLAESGLDERDPLADRRLVDFSLSLPPEQLLDNGCLRPLARRALTGIVPQEVLGSTVRGYQGGDWAAFFDHREARKIVDEIAECRSVTEFIDIKRLRSMCVELPSGGLSRTDDVLYRNRFFTALSTGVFIQEFEKRFGDR